MPLAEAQAQQIQQGQQQTPQAQNPIVGSIAPIFQDQVVPEKATPPTNQPQAAPTADSDKISLTQEEYASLNQRAKNYETIVSDPQANSFLTSYFRDMAIQQNNKSPSPQTVQTDSNTNANKGAENPVEERVALLEGRLNEGLEYLQSIQTSMGRIALDAFKARNTDFDSYSNQVREIMLEVPGISVHKAYEFAKRMGNGHSQNSSSVAPPAANTVERGRVGIPEQSDVVSQASQKILSRQATPGDTYILEAYKAAQQLHGGS